MTEHTADIIDVVEGAIQVYADAIIESDSLFDNFGGTHPIRSITRRKRLTRAVRCDGWIAYFEPDDIVTILPTEQRGRAIDRESSGSVQGYIETGRYSTVDEELAMNPGSHA